MKRLVLACVLAAAGCAGVPKTAVVDGQTVPRLTIEYNGQPYTVKHEGAHPRPGSPASGLRDAGGSIRGRVCGMFVDLEVRHRGDHVEVIGSIDNHIDASISVTQKDGQRVFTGNLGPLGIDFFVTPERMEGHVGTRVFALEPQGDGYAGHMRMPGIMGDGTVTVTLNGKQALWEMVPADEAAVLPALMTCNPGGGQFRMMEGLVVGMGGEATDRPPETSAVFTRR
jgi:hypothetical protein